MKKILYMVTLLISLFFTSHISLNAATKLKIEDTKFTSLGHFSTNNESKTIKDKSDKHIVYYDTNINKLVINTKYLNSTTTNKELEIKLRELIVGGRLVTENNFNQPVYRNLNNNDFTVVANLNKVTHNLIYTLEINDRYNVNRNNFIAIEVGLKKNDANISEIFSGYAKPLHSVLTFVDFDKINVKNGEYNTLSEAKKNNISQIWDKKLIFVDQANGFCSGNIIDTKNKDANNLSVSILSASHCYRAKDTKIAIIYSNQHINKKFTYTYVFNQKQHEGYKIFPLLTKSSDSMIINITMPKSMFKNIDFLKNGNFHQKFSLPNKNNQFAYYNYNANQINLTQSLGHYNYAQPFEGDLPTTQMPIFGSQNKGGNSGSVFYDLKTGNAIGINSRYLVSKTNQWAEGQSLDVNKYWTSVWRGYDFLNLNIMDSFSEEFYNKLFKLRYS